MRRFVALGMILVFCSACMAGCAGTYRKKPSAEYFPACYEPVKKIKDKDRRIAMKTAGGSILGALAGALIGLAVDRSVKGRCWVRQQAA